MILARYIARAMAQGYLLVALVFVALFSFIELIQQLDDVGAAYRMADAFLYVLMMLPRRLLDATPVIALLGTLVPLLGCAVLALLIVLPQWRRRRR
jgi:lipopolysaccharide export system permease protein